MTKAKAKERPWIVCVGEPARAVVFGWSATEPKPDRPYRLLGARMLLEWRSSGGLFAVAEHGPGKGTRITCAVSVTSGIARQVLAVSAPAAHVLTEWPDA